MDDQQNQNQQAPADGAQGTMSSDPMSDTTQMSAAPLQMDPSLSMGSMADLASMTPPPAPVTSVTPPTGDTGASQAMSAQPASPGAGQADDYSYAEDILNEILDSLDRIEAKLEAMEKKMG